VSFKSLLHNGQNVALMNHKSTHFAWKTWLQSSTRQISVPELKTSWQIAQPSCLYRDAIASFHTTNSLC